MPFMRRSRLFRRRAESGPRDEAPPTVPPGGWGPPLRRSTADSLASLNEHLRLLRLGSAGHPEDPDVRPPTYLEATATLAPGVIPEEKDGCEKRHEPGANPSSTSEFIDPTLDEAGAEQQLLDVATAFIPPPPTQQACASTSAASNSVPQEGDLSRPVDLATHPLPGPQTAFPRLVNPVLIPRIAPGPTLPFARALPPALLESHGIAEPVFLAFVDHLNLLCSPHPVLKALEIASVAVGFVPLDYGDGLAAVLQLICILTGHVIAKRRCTAYLERVNEAFFAPRGLHARIIGTKELRRVLGLPKNDQLISPLSAETVELTCQERCLAGLEARGAARLETENLALPSKETTLLAKLMAWQVRRKLSEFEKNSKRARKRALKRRDKGKKIKGEGWGERMRVKWLGWILIEDLTEWEKVAEKRKQARGGSRWEEEHATPPASAKKDGAGKPMARTDAGASGEPTLEEKMGAGTKDEVLHLPTNTAQTKA